MMTPLHMSLSTPPPLSTLLAQPNNHSQTTGELLLDQESNRDLTEAKEVPSERANIQTGSLTNNNNNSNSNAPIVDSEALWESYRETMSALMNEARVLKKKTPASMQRVRTYLLQNLRQLEIVSPTTKEKPALAEENTEGSYRQQVKRQQERFLQQTQFTLPEYEYLTRCLTYLGDVSAKRQQSEPIPVAWYKIKEAGLIPRENCVSTFMYVLSQDESFLSTALEVATFHDGLYEPNEKTVTLRIKALMALGDAAAAEQVLFSLPDKKTSHDEVDGLDATPKVRPPSSPSLSQVEWKRLRTFIPILQHYCQTGPPESILRLFRHMRQSDGVHLDAETYALVLSALARLGRFALLTSPIAPVGQFGFSAASGPVLLDELLEEMSQDLLELTEEAARSIYQALLAASGDHRPPSPTLDLVRTADNLLWLGRVTVNETTGICPETGIQLRLFTLTEPQRKQVRDSLLSMAAATNEEHNERLKSKGRTYQGRDADYALDELGKFSDWLLHRDGELFTAIVDGPNVAYFGHGDVHYSQVLMVVEELEHMGERPLVVMPQKYITETFWVSSSLATQTLTARELGIMNQLLETGRMYAVPHGCLDDYYWMLASVANQASHQTRVLPDNKDGRFPGVRPMLITNDQMRDHRLELLEPRLFRRWTSCHVVNYYFKPYDVDEWEERQLEFFPADFFSREMQSNPISSSDKGEKSLVWHLPVTDWPKTDRLCIHLSRAHT